MATLYNPQLRMVDVSGIDRKELLLALWENARIPDLNTNTNPFIYALCFTPPRYTKDSIAQEVNGKWVDYIAGRPIKVKIFSNNNLLDPCLYDKNNGKGSFKKVVEMLRPVVEEDKTHN